MQENDIQIQEVIDKFTSLSPKERVKKVMHMLMLTVKKCLYCSSVFSGGILNDEGDFNGVFLFHVKETHVVHPELFISMINGAVESFAEKRCYGIDYGSPE